MNKPSQKKKELPLYCCKNKPRVCVLEGTVYQLWVELLWRLPAVHCHQGLASGGDAVIAEAEEPLAFWFRAAGWQAALVGVGLGWEGSYCPGSNCKLLRGTPTACTASPLYITIFTSSTQS